MCINTIIAIEKSHLCKYKRINGDGNEPVVGYCFTEYFVCDYQSLIKHSGSLTNIQAVTDCSALVLSMKEIASFLGVTPETVSHIRRKLR